MRCASMVFAVALASSPACFAGTMIQINSIDDFYATGVSAPVPDTLIIGGAHMLKDGGGGTFNHVDTGCTDQDRGVTIKDANNHCYRRQFAGTVHMLWYGLPNPTLASINQAINKAFAAAKAYGNNAVSTDNLTNLRIAETLDIPEDRSLDCGGTPPQTQRLGADYRNVPGSLLLSHDVSIIRSRDHRNTSLHNCTILSDTFYRKDVNGDPLMPLSVRDEIAMLENMRNNHDTGVICGEAGCNDHDLLIMGFDTGYEATNAPSSHVTNVFVDADVCFWAHNTGGIANWDATSCYPFATHGLDGIGNTYAKGNDGNTEWWSIYSVGAGENQAGTQLGPKCRLTLNTTGQTYTTEDLKQTDTIWVSNLNKRWSCNGRWKPTIVNSTQIDLDGSSYNGPQTTGVLDPTSKIVTGIGDMTDIVPGQTLKSDPAGAFDANTKVVAVFKGEGQKMVAIDKFPRTPGGSTTILFQNANADPTFQACTGGEDNLPAGNCVWLSAGGRFLTGTSNGAKAALRATGYLVGGTPFEGGDDSLQVNGLATFGAMAFQHDVEFHVHDGDNIGFSLAGSDDDGLVDDPTTINVLVDGADENVEFLGRKSGKDGTSLMVHNTNAVGCVDYDSTNAKATDPGSNAFELDGGCVVVSGVRGMAEGHGLIASTAPTFLTNNFAPQVDVFYASDAARAATLATANRFLNGSDIGSDVVLSKGTAAAGAPGANFCRLQWVIDNPTAGTGKLIAYCGTSGAAANVVTNVGGGL